MTAISSRDGYSVLECWQLASVPVDAMSAANYAVGGNATAATWSHIEPRTRVGEAWAPHVQLSIILNGLIRITSPAPAADTSTTANASGSIASVLPREVEVASSARPDTHVAYIMPGTLRSSVVIAADLKAASTLAGHFTEFPSDEPTVLVQIPFARDAAPEHTVLHDGPCTG
ncbi:hypothetical protein B0T26DRAFT_679586 [Lasiosphaeria miniovina]|uniref:Uncharacterized protein n=1 Tax=Lasiosphaeria miniovina TaxID=1954250 RepID=A0AA40A6Y9_9PEZI|nr:uncharacterized protein B0T26DRAFT_679586 [Lasiosphaeria miniovina]KAK0710293.1 hypothetical protein B0T26DRAFT_679586 [Lasiosphaeria miniovina]